VTTIILIFGLFCLIFAVISGGLKAQGIEIPVLHSVPAQIVLFALGVILVSASLLVDRGGSPPPPLPPPPLSPSAPPPPAVVESPPEKYPLFPWPPPWASAIAEIPRNMLEAEHSLTQLRDVDRKITEALEQSEYYESSYYAIPAGFALVTKMEQIEYDGTPKQGLQRWSLEPWPLARFSLSNYLAALFRATSGYYRVIVFIVTHYPFTQSRVQITQEETAKWLSGGLNRLPSPIGDIYFSNDYACTALIYEFERATDAKEPSIRRPGLIPGRTHLVKAGIWGALQQWPR
jgi:hypothetical protein